MHSITESIHVPAQSGDSVAMQFETSLPHRAAVTSSSGEFAPSHFSALTVTRPVETGRAMMTLWNVKMFLMSSQRTSETKYRNILNDVMFACHRSFHCYTIPLRFISIFAMSLFT